MSVIIVFEDDDIEPQTTNILIPPVVKDRIKGQKYMVKGVIKIWSGTRWHCIHDKRGSICLVCNNITKSKRREWKKTHEKYSNECKDRELDLPVDRDDNKYVNDSTKLYHKCKILEHKEYPQTPNNHLHGYGCPLCGKIKNYLTQTKTHKQYVNECKERKIDLPVNRKDNKYVNDGTGLYHKCKISEHDEYLQTPNSHLQGRSCILCTKKSEALLLTSLRESSIMCETQAEFNWCKSQKTDKYLPFDFLYNKFKIIIELDGRHHFQDIKYWRSNSKDQQERDCYKMKLAISNGYTVIRISQPDFAKDNELAELIIPYIKPYDKPEVIYIANDPTIYDAHKAIMQIPLENKD